MLVLCFVNFFPVTDDWTKPLFQVLRSLHNLAFKEGDGHLEAKTGRSL